MATRKSKAIPLGKRSAPQLPKNTDITRDLMGARKARAKYEAAPIARGTVPRAKAPKGARKAVAGAFNGVHPRSPGGQFKKKG